MPMDAAMESGAADVTSMDVAPQDTGSNLCGTQMCAAGEVCVRPCCGGASPACVDRDDGGMCPSGAEFGPCQVNGMFQQGCRYTCTPPPPSCAAAPSSGCNGTNCSVCPSGNGRRQGNEILCLCQ